MRIILIGCEYSGKSTLAAGISRWWTEHAGGPAPAWHDHFVRPFLEETGPEAEQVMAMRPSLLEKYSRYMLEYHLNHHFYLDNHHLLVDWYYADEVYAPLYYGYGGPGAYSERGTMARRIDEAVMRAAPDTVLVLLRAAPPAIRGRRATDTHACCPLDSADVEHVLERFDEEFTRSRIRRKFELDVAGSPAATLDAFWAEMEPHLSGRDQRALLLHARIGAEMQVAVPGTGPRKLI